MTDDAGATPQDAGGAAAAVDVAAVRDLARERLVPVAESGEPGRVNRDLVRTLAGTGLLGRLFPARLGGSGDGPLRAATLCALREALAYVSVEVETALAVQGLGAHPIVHGAHPRVAERLAPGLAAGERLAAFALTEPDAGSDAAAIALEAEPDGDGWRLTGEKHLISNAPDADLYTVFGRTTPDAGARGVSAFVVDGHAPGLSGEPIDVLGGHPVGRLVFDGVPVPADHLLGEEDRGFAVAMRTLDLFRPSVGALAVGMAQRALDLATVRAREREAFGRPIGGFQGVSHQLADVAVAVEASRLLVGAAADAHDAGADARLTRRSAMAKLHATETAQQAVDVAIQVHGGEGLRSDGELARLYREVRAPRIYEGTSEIQRNIIARDLLARD